MKNISTALQNALSSTLKNPVWLLRLKLESSKGGGTLYLADREHTLWGEMWRPLVLGWGPVDRYFDPSEREVKVADVTVELSNRPEALGVGEGNISRILRECDLAASSATLYLWLDGAGLEEPSGADHGDLVTILTGRPELSLEITPAVCPLDIVSRDGEWADDDCPWGDLLKGRLTRNQWGSLPKDRIGDFKPAVFGDDVVCEGIPLSGPVRAGSVAGPVELFDHSTGADRVIVSFPEGGEVNANNPYPAPFDMYIGDWRFTVRRPPEKLIDGSWEYKIDNGEAGARYYLPTPLSGATPVFAPVSDRLWPRSDEDGRGPYSSFEPATGAPFQFFHGEADTGNWRDGNNPGRGGATIKKVYVDGVEAAQEDVAKDDAFGVAWIKGKSGAPLGKAGNPETLRVKWTSVDGGFTTGDQWLRASQLTSDYPYGFNSGASPCILGDFAVPASGGGAPVSSKLGLSNSVRYPYLGARAASVRFVMTYTGVETSAGTFHVRLFGRDYGFDSSELSDGAGIKSGGWWVAKSQKGVEFEIWPGNDGYPYTETSPNPRFWDMYELSRDVTDDALAHLAENGGFADSFRAWFTGTEWPDTNSIMVLACELEIQFDPVESILNGPRVTALIGGSASAAGQIIASLIPQDQQGEGFDDQTLPNLKYRIDSQQSVCRFIRTVTRESNTELKKNFSTGKWDLVKRSETRDNLSLPPATGGAAVIAQDDLLADEDGLPMIRRVRSAPETVVNEVTVFYVGEDGSKSSVTLWDHGSTSVYGIRRHTVDLGAAMTRQAAEDHALDILNAHAEVSDYYTLVFPLGPAVAIEPNDILSVTADMDGLADTKMRVVSVEVDPGDIAHGRLSIVTVNAQRYSRARTGFGKTPFGQAPYGRGLIVEN